jgi:hypothetical protein
MTEEKNRFTRMGTRASPAKFVAMGQCLPSATPLNH